MIASIGQLQQVDGSSTLEIGESKVITSVTGPIEVSRIRNENPTKAFLDINIRPSAGVPSTRETTLEVQLNEILSAVVNAKQYPRQQIQVVVQILRAGESTNYTVLELVTIVNSVFLSLLNAGVSLKTSFLATSCAISEAGYIIAKPSGSELEKSKSHHIIVFSLKDSKVDELIYSNSLGNFTEKELFTVYDNAATDIELSVAEYRAAVADRVKADYTWRM